MAKKFKHHVWAFVLLSMSEFYSVVGNLHINANVYLSMTVLLLIKQFL